MPIQKVEIGGDRVDKVECVNCKEPVLVKKGNRATVYCSEKCYDEFSKKRLEP